MTYSGIIIILSEFYSDTIVQSELALKLKPLIAAKANQRASGGAVPQKSAKPVDTRQELARAGSL